MSVDQKYIAYIMLVLPHAHEHVQLYNITYYPFSMCVHGPEVSCPCCVGATALLRACAASQYNLYPFSMCVSGPEVSLPHKVIATA